MSEWSRFYIEKQSFNCSFKSIVIFHLAFHRAPKPVEMKIFHHLREEKNQ